MRRIGRALALCLIAACPATPALAQNRPLPPNPVPQGSPIPRILPRASPDVVPAVPQQAPGPAAMPPVDVAVTQVRIEGATAYPLSRLEPLVAGLTGPNVSLEGIEEARLALLRRYREDGYVLTGVSAEVEPGGRLRFIIAEGRIVEVLLDGDIGPAATQVLLFLQRLVTVGPLDQALLERQLLLAQEVPGVSVRSVLRPAPGGDPGALQLIAQVARTPWSALVAADNRGYQLVGPEQAVAVLSLNSFTQFGERTDFVLFRSMDDTQTFGQVAFESFVGSSGLRLRLTAGRGGSNPSGALSQIGYEGTTSLASAGLLYPVVRRRSQAVTAFAGIEALENEIRLAGPGGTEQVASQDSLRVIRVGLESAAQDVFLGDAFPALNTAFLRFSQGLPGLGASANGAALAGRVGQDVDFFKMTGEATRSQTLFSPWDGATVALFGLAAFQWSPDVLPPIERFYLGGLRLNRGYYAGEVTGDSGMSTTVELRLDDVYQVPLDTRTLEVGAQYYAFWDWGQSWNNQDDQLDRRLASVGAGVRLLLDRSTEVQFEGVSRLTRYPQGYAPGVTPLAQNAAYWRVVLRF
jgi:hemolysin activation/secretion protein